MLTSQTIEQRAAALDVGLEEAREAGLVLNDGRYFADGKPCCTLAHTYALLGGIEESRGDYMIDCIMNLINVPAEDRLRCEYLLRFAESVSDGLEGFDLAADMVVCAVTEYGRDVLA